MYLGNIPSTLCRVFVFALATVSVGAAPKFDLERVKPVPGDVPIPTMDFFRPRVLSRPELNPSGTHVAAIITAAEDKHQLLVYDINTQKIDTVGAGRDEDIYFTHWLNDSRLIFGLTARKMYGLGLLAAEVGSLRSAFPVQQYGSSVLVSIRLKDRLHPLIWNRSDIDVDRDTGVMAINTERTNGIMIDLYRADAGYSDILQVRENNEKHIADSYAVQPWGISYGYMTDKVGELAYNFAALDGNLAMFRLEGKQWQKCPVDLEQVDVLDAANESGQVIVLGPRQEGKPRALQLMEPATGKLGDVVLQDPGYDFDGWFYRNPTTGDILGAVYERNGPRVFWFNEDYRNLQKTLDGYFPGLIVRIYGSDTKHRLFLVGTYSDKQPVSYSWVDLETHKAGLIKNSAPWIDPQRMQAMNIMKFKTRDGRQLDAYLTLPAGASKANPAPLVVLCHGGPWARDTWGFDGEVQFLASHGYAVMQPNYRGSTGYGWMFPVEDEWDYLKMHDDVTDATKAVIGTGMIDSDRTGIMGASFGGYLAVSGVAHEPERYRCAVTNAGLFDVALHIQSEKFGRYDNPSYGRRVLKMGDPKKYPEKFAAMSPINFVDHIRVPVFVAGGKDDRTVEIEQSKRLVSALEKYKVPYEKYFVGEEGHGMRHLKNEVELYDQIVVFLDKYLKPVRTAAGTP